MRPHKLVMKAFGPFANETAVDFDAMGSGIYLISGDTGSGKTTIFDALIYALYGTASGGGRSRLSTEAFQSDYARSGERREEMRVSLTFSNAGHTYEVTRRMYWGKKGEAQKAVKESVLSENGRMIAAAKGREDRDEVTAKITEILGLNADQFRRIMMLAQGEFQRFLTAGSDERGEILGRLYDNRRYEDFQCRLKAAAALAEKKDAAISEKIRAQTGFFALPDDASEEEKEALAPEHPDLPDVMEAMLGRMRTKRDGYAEEIQHKAERLTHLNAQKTLGEANNRLLDDLEAAEKRLKLLEEQKEEMDGLSRNISEAESAGKILPLHKALKEAKKGKEISGKRISDLGKQRETLAAQAAKAEEAAESAEKTLAPRVAEMNGKAAAMRSRLHFYDEYRAAMDAYGEKAGQLQAAETDAEEKRKTAADLKEERAHLAETLTKLETAGEAAVLEAVRREETLKERKRALKEIADAAASLRTLMFGREKAAQRLLEAQNASVRAEETHLRLNKAFLSGQAGILASGMREELLTSDTVVCPVCGSVHTAEESASFAKAAEHVPSREAVDQALTRWTEEKRAEAAAEKAFHEADSGVRTAQEVLRIAAEKEFGTVRPENILKDGLLLEEKTAECEAALKEAEDARRSAELEKAEKDKALAALERNRSASDEAETARLSALEILQQKKAEAETAKAGALGWKKQLEGHPETKEEALRQILSYEEEAAQLQGRIDKARTTLEECRQQQADKEGNLSEAVLEDQRREQTLREAEQAFRDGLAGRHFQDEAAWIKAISPDGILPDEEDLSARIAAMRDTRDDYERRCAQSRAAAAQLKESAQGLARCDLKALETEIETAARELETLRGAERSLHTRLSADEAVFRNVSDLLKEKKRNRFVLEELRPLSDTANGHYAFSRYVLGGFFRRIVDAANVHLQTLTDGEYCLLPVETGDGRRTLGLGLKVENMMTGTVRDTETLSGGQSFEASLSLALGLSDIVQMESTGSVRIDSMFIDEGFGSLDGAHLDKAVEVLHNLSDGRRQIGIISHVSRLDECLTKKIRVVAGERGSSVRIEV